MPKRIQRRRVKGWRMPAGAVSVTRPGRWGNPYRACLFINVPPGERVAKAVEHFRHVAIERMRKDGREMARIPGENHPVWAAFAEWFKRYERNKARRLARAKARAAR